MTGAGGFAGRWMLRCLRERGLEAVAAVRKAGSIADFPEVVLDLDDPATIFAALDRIRPNAIVHLAAMASPHLSNIRPEAVYGTNFLGTHRVLEGCRILGLRPRILLVGSATVYGHMSPSEPPMDEDRPVKPTDHYSVAKAATEMLAAVFSKHFPVVVARPFNHTGPGQGIDFALPSFASQIARCEAGLQDPVLRVGDLSAERDYLDVRDVVSAYSLLLERGEPGSAVNVCSGSALPVSEWLRRLSAMSNVPVRLETDPIRLFGQPNPRLVGDNSRLKSLGWAPSIPADEMLRSLLDHWRSRIREDA